MEKTIRRTSTPCLSASQNRSALQQPSSTHIHQTHIPNQTNSHNFFKKETETETFLARTQHNTTPSMGNCAYKVDTLATNGIVALNAATLEPYPIWDDGATNLYLPDEHKVFIDNVDNRIRFQCIDPNDIIYDLESDDPFIFDPNTGSALNYFVHTCTEEVLSDVPFPYICYSAPSSTRTESMYPTTYPTSSPSSNPSSIPTSSHAPSIMPTSSPSSIPSSVPSSTPSTSSIPSSMPSSVPSMSLQPTSSPSSIPTTSSQPSSTPSSQPSDAPSTSSEQNNDLIGELREDLTSLTELMSVKHVEIMSSINALNTRIDNLEQMLLQIQNKQMDMDNRIKNNWNEITRITDYFNRKIQDTQYWVRRTWYYATAGGDINFEDDHIWTR